MTVGLGRESGSKLVELTPLSNSNQLSWLKVSIGESGFLFWKISKGTCGKWTLPKLPKRHLEKHNNLWIDDWC